MDYPMWQPGIGGGVLMGLVAATHVIVAQFAIDGGLAITRHQVRVLYLEPVSRQIETAAASKWLIFALFAVLLMVALGTVAWMVRAVARNPATGDEAA